MSAASPTATAPLAPAQHKANLWAQPEVKVFSVLMGTRVPGLAARLAAAKVADFDCLLPGALEPEAAARAPYLAQLEPDSEFTDWLLSEASGTFESWGLLVRSPARLVTLRNHLRGHLQARLPDGQSIPFDWMDPQVLRQFLPLSEPMELDAFFGPVRSLVIPGTQDWLHLELQGGRLAQRSVPIHPDT